MKFFQVLQIRVLLSIQFLLFNGILKSKAQELSPWVISGGGAFYENGSGSLSTTIAELSAVTTISSGSITLTQGFEQTWDFSTGENEDKSEMLLFSIYPNPTTGKFEFFVQSTGEKRMIIRIIDVLGREVQRTNVESRDLICAQRVSISGSPGIYQVELIVEDDHAKYARHFVKQIELIR